VNADGRYLPKFHGDYTTVTTSMIISTADLWSLGLARGSKVLVAGGPITACKQMTSVGNRSFVYYSDMTETACE